MHAGEESHCGIVPMNPSNDGQDAQDKRKMKNWSQEHVRRTMAVSAMRTLTGGTPVPNAPRNTLPRFGDRRFWYRA